MVLNTDHKETLITMPRERRSISFDPDLLKWIDEQVASDYHYKDRSHFIEILVREHKDRVEEK